MSSFVQFAIAQGVPLGTIELMFMFPIVVTIIAASRQIVGIKGFGIYTPSIITLAFLSTGLKYGVFLFLVILVIGMVSRVVIKEFRLLYLPRVAIMLTIVSVVTFLLLIFGGYFRRTGLASVSIFPLLIMITIMEKFIVVQIEKGAKTAVFLSFETLLVSTIAYLITSISSLKHLMLSYPWLLILVVLVNFGLGKWTGLRFSEYFRFKEVVKNVELSQKK